MFLYSFWIIYQINTVTALVRLKKECICHMHSEHATEFLSKNETTGMNIIRIAWYFDYFTVQLMKRFFPYFLFLSFFSWDKQVMTANVSEMWEIVSETLQTSFICEHKNNKWAIQSQLVQYQSHYFPALDYSSLFPLKVADKLEDT